MSVPMMVRPRHAKPRQRKPQGVILYRGPSLLTGERIVCVVTGLARRSRNSKTGVMLQSYILGNFGLDPIAAAKSGRDEAICGNCPHRAQDGKLGSCYVNLIQGPQPVWHAVQDGGYPLFNRRKHLRYFKGRSIRLGSYGDPAAVPLGRWQVLLSVASNWTGYTHQWRTCDQDFARILMASVETPLQAEQARMMGWRTFRVRLPDQPVLEGEFVCPASDEGGKRMTCERCKACSGAKTSPRAVSPVIMVHGSTRIPWKQQVYQRTMGRLLTEESGRLTLPVVK